MNKHLTISLSYKYLKYLFNENDFRYSNDLKKIKLDSTSIYSITPYKYSLLMINIIMKHVKTKDITITDACSCIGADTITFCKNFKRVNAIELCSDRFCFLKDNLNLLNFNNYKLYNNDCMKIIKNIDQDIIYFDPPWGGRNYKNKKHIDLFISGISISKICNLVKKYTSYICLKVPNNFLFKKFKNDINFEKFFNYDLEKFHIIIIY